MTVQILIYKKTKERVKLYKFDNHWIPIDGPKYLRGMRFLAASLSAYFINPYCFKDKIKQLL